MELILLYGEDGAQQPGTTAGAASYKAAHNYSDGVHVVADPSWQKMASAVSHPSTIGLPFIILIAGDMEILKVDATAQDVISILQEKTGIEIQTTCEGSCGGQSVSGCWCDELCAQYGDCCPDVCDLCGLHCN